MATSIGKTRIYDLARSLVPESLSEKDKKNLQSVKTKLIIDICESLGHPNKTPSSSIDNQIVSQILVQIDKVSPGGNTAANSNVTVPSTSHRPPSQHSPAVSEPQKKSRVLRRILPDKPLEEQIEEVPEAVQEEEVVVPVEAVVEIETPPVKEEPVKEIEEKPPVENKINTPLKTITPNANTNNITRPLVQPIRPPLRESETKPLTESERNQKFGNRTQASPTHPPNRPAQGPAQNLTQPYRVAKPINTSFPTRRKSAAPPRRNQPNRGAPTLSRAQTLAKEKELANLARPSELVLTHPVTVKELAQLLSVQETEVIRFLFLKGIMRTVNQTLEVDLTIQVAAELGCTITMEQPKSDQSEDLASRLKELVDTHTVGDSFEGDVIHRPPVVTIMGHVDHGKTTLLDAIRKSKFRITSTESGGITQHIGAYQIEVTDYDGKTRKVTFLDTPGHEAFTALRARGAQVTDIAILVVAADDGVMPQTIEAISHVKAAGVPLIVAVNKIDKPDANPDKVLTQLLEHEIVVEDYGGKVVCSKISAKQNLHLEDLLSKITLVADAELGTKLLSNPTSRAVGAVIEAALSPNKGPVATLLVQSGTLKKGDSIAVGSSFGRVRAIFNDIGEEIQEAPPATPVQVLGLDSLPQAGDTFQVFKNSQDARASATVARDEQSDKKRMNRGLEYFSSQVREGVAKELAVIIKADVQGSAEAISQELNKLSTDLVHVRIIHCAAGAINENDVNLASATNAILVNFNSSVEGNTQRIAADNGVPIYNYNIIYQVTDAVRKAINGLLEPEKIEIKHGQAEIRQIFSFGKSKIAGCFVTEGKLVRGSVAKIIRNKKEIATVKLDELKRFKDDAKEVVEGFECGVSFDAFNDFLAEDIIESWGVEFQERSI